ncbi:MAG: sulfite exporter TauE/SafE family protein [Microthrixaceae bacterium]|nr:sulfite exporter TauE/SafE family protein [Microthrixaceae bacterium]
MSGWEVIAVCAAVFVAAGTQQLAGFGYALMAVPLLSLVVGTKDAVALSSLSGLAGTGLMAIRLRHRTDRPVVKRLLLGAVVGMPLGIVVLRRAPAAPLQVAVSVVVLLAVALLASGFRLRRESPRTELGAGFLSGMINTSIGIGGPPVVLVLQAAEHEQHAFRATTVSYFVVSNLVALPLFLASGVVSSSTWAVGVFAVPAALVGTLVFERVAFRVRTEHFRVLVLALLVLAAVVSLARVLG